jgi:hypothetical protein
LDPDPDPDPDPPVGFTEGLHFGFGFSHLVEEEDDDDVLLDFPVDPVFLIFFAAIRKSVGSALRFFWVSQIFMISKSESV